MLLDCSSRPARAETATAAPLSEASQAGSRGHLFQGRKRTSGWKSRPGSYFCLHLCEHLCSCPGSRYCSCADAVSPGARTEAGGPVNGSYEEGGQRDHRCEWRSINLHSHQRPMSRARNIQCVGERLSGRRFSEAGRHTRLVSSVDFIFCRYSLSRPLFSDKMLPC